VLHNIITQDNQTIILLTPHLSIINGETNPFSLYTHYSNRNGEKKLTCSSIPQLKQNNLKYPSLFTHPLL